MRRRVLHLRQEDAGPLWRAVASALALDDAAGRSLVTQGAVYVRGRRCQEPAHPVGEGDVLTVVLEESGRSTLPAPAGPARELVVLYEDADLLAVDKPPGLPAQPTVGRTGDSLLDLVSARLGRPAGLVHRLDRDTSGVTVFGKTPEATSELARQFREGAARKRYLAVAGAALADEGEIDWPISKDPSRPGRYRALRTANGRSAHTRWRVLSRGEGLCLVELRPTTGRTHQLRAHLAALASPIAGDALYGGPKGPPRCLLHAAELELTQPTSRSPLHLEAPLPEDFRAALAGAALA